MRVVITVNRLRKWAAAKPADAVIGIARNCEYCPIANYLYEQGCEDVHVTKPIMSFTDPDWNRRHRCLSGTRIDKIITGVDSLHLPQRRAKVTAAEFLRILDSVEGKTHE